MSNDFYDRVYDVVKQIPVGCVTSYGAIARAVGAGRSARTVGYALNAVAGDDRIPCHRVVNRNGELTGKTHFGGPDVMRTLLEKEGVTFQDDTVVMDKHYWDPARSLN